MNKKLLLGAALLIGMGPVFTSCVDSTESASVTAVREAKAEQLKSLAELNKANAEAAIILANAQQAAQAASQAYQEAQAKKMEAEAALLRAQADLEEAKAAYQNALAADLNAKTEADKKRLDAELQQAQAEYERTMAEVEAQKLRNQQAEIELANLQEKLQKQIEQLQAAIDQQEAYTARVNQEIEQMKYDLNRQIQTDANSDAAQAALQLKTYMQDYELALKNLNSAKRNLASAEKTLLAGEANLLSEQQRVEENIAVWMKDIANAKLDNEKQQAIIDAFSQFAGKHVTESDVASAFTAYQTAVEAAQPAKEASEAADKAFDTAKNNLEGAADDGNKGPNKYAELVNRTIRPTYSDNYEGTGNSYSYWVYDEDNNQADRYTFEISYRDNSSNIPAACQNTYALYLNHKIYDYREFTYTTTDPNTGKEVEYKYWDWYQKTDPDAITYTPVYASKEWSLDVVTVDGVDVPTYVYSTYLNLLNDGAGLEDWKELRLNSIKYNTNDQLDDYKDKLAEAQKAQTAAKTAYLKAYDDNETAKTAVKTAEAELEAAKTAQANPPANATAEQLAALNKAVTDKQTALGEKQTAASTASEELQTARGTLNSANSSVENWNSQIISMENYLAGQASSADDVNKLVEDIIAEAANNDALIAAYNTAAADKAEKNELYAQAQDAADNAQDIYYEIKTAYEGGELYGGENAPNSSSDAYWQETEKFFNDKVVAAENAISDNNKNIAEWQDNIDDANKTLENLKSDNPNYWYNGWMYKDWKEYQEAIIENYKEEVEVAEERAKIAKAQLESVLNEAE